MKCEKVYLGYKLNTISGDQLVERQSYTKYINNGNKLFSSLAFSIMRTKLKVFQMKLYLEIPCLCFTPSTLMNQMDLLKILKIVPGFICIFLFI